MMEKDECTACPEKSFDAFFSLTDLGQLCKGRNEEQNYEHEHYTTADHHSHRHSLRELEQESGHRTERC